MSSTILYLAIVAIWAGVLVPRWLRREPHHETSSRDASRDTPSQSRRAATLADPEAADADIAGDAAVGAVGAHGQDDHRQRSGVDTGRRGGSDVRARAMAARRRLFGIVVAVAFAAMTIVAAGLATWWVVVPPAIMLAGCVALLREAAGADAELRQARGAAASGRRSHRPVSARPESDSVGGAAADPVADAVVEPAAGPVAVAEDAGTAEVVDIMSRVDEELYDQYADAKLRAVGD